jgi:glycosyltransferase involved in cell wall biosynthesis
VEDKTILYLGNKLQSKRSNPTTIELLSNALSQEGFNLLTYSSKKNKLARLIQMCYAIVRHRKKADIALIDTYSTTAFWFAYISCKILNYFKIPYIPILHGGNLPTRFKNSKKAVVWLLNHSKINVSPSDYLYGFFKTKDIKNLVKIPNFISIENYKFKCRSKPGPHLLWVRAFDNIYNPLLALKTLELILEKYPNVKLSMVGPEKDNSFNECKTYAEEKNLPVTFTGKLTKKEWIAYADNFDFFLNTTNIDNMPVSVIEAMAMGMLVVSTNVGGIPYILKNKKNGLLVKPDDEFEMAKAIDNLLLNQELSVSLSKNARLKAEEFSWEEVKLKWFDVLR